MTLKSKTKNPPVGSWPFDPFPLDRSLSLWLLFHLSIREPKGSVLERPFNYFGFFFVLPFLSLDVFPLFFWRGVLAVHRPQSSLRSNFDWLSTFHTLWKQTSPTHVPFRPKKKRPIQRLEPSIKIRFNKIESRRAGQPAATHWRP